MFERNEAPKPENGEKIDPKLENLADKVMERLAVTRGTAGKGSNGEESLFLRVASEVFNEEEIPPEEHSRLRKEIGKILNQRKPRLIFTKGIKEKIMAGAIEQQEKNRQMGINEQGDSIFE